MNNINSIVKYLLVLNYMASILVYLIVFSKGSNRVMKLEIRYRRLPLRPMYPGL
jgi:hypothetical protein